MALIKKPATGANVLDIEAARAARAEARGNTQLQVIKVDGGYVEINPEFDLITTELLTEGKVREGLARLLNDPADVDLILKNGFSDKDLEELVKFITGKLLGELPASVISSKKVGKN